MDERLPEHDRFDETTIVCCVELYLTSLICVHDNVKCVYFDYILVLSELLLINNVMNILSTFNGKPLAMCSQRAENFQQLIRALSK